MAIRGDITIDWELSPRIITVASPSVSCSMQDLLDTLRHLESQGNAMDDPPIVDASGKESLGGGTKVGITVKLLNAKVAFEARDGSSGWILCSLEGGNLVAVDENGSDIDARHPTAFVTIDRTSSASATLQEQDALNYSSYDGGITINIALSDAEGKGTEFPIGTVEHPVNNLIDARSIAIEKGFDKFWLIGNLPITATTDVSGFTISNRSHNPLKSIVSIDPASNTNSTQILRCEVSGELDNGVILEECILSGITYINGFINKSVLSSFEIILGGNETAMFMDCKSGVPNAMHTEPSINLGGSGQNLLLSRYDGDISLRNKTGTDFTSIRMVGLLRIEDTCVAGHIEVYGDTFIVDHDMGEYINGIGKSELIDRTSGTKEEIAKATMEYTRA